MNPKDQMNPTAMYETISGKKASAECLYQHGHYNNSAYLAGYVLEVAYKLAIRLSGEEHPFTHNFGHLAETCPPAILNSKLSCVTNTRLNSNGRCSTMNKSSGAPPSSDFRPYRAMSLRSVTRSRQRRAFHACKPMDSLIAQSDGAAGLL